MISRSFPIASAAMTLALAIGAGFASMPAVAEQSQLLKIHPSFPPISGDRFATISGSLRFSRKDIAASTIGPSVCDGMAVEVLDAQVHLDGGASVFDEVLTGGTIHCNYTFSVRPGRYWMAVQNVPNGLIASKSGTYPAMKPNSAVATTLPSTFSIGAAGVLFTEIDAVAGATVYRDFDLTFLQA